MNKIIKLPIALVVVIAAVFLLEVIIPGDLSSMGIQPRSLFGLFGIIFSPFLHADLTHLLSNAFPLLILGSLVSALSPQLFVIRTIMLILLSGALTWLISSSGTVVGASGLVFAYWAFLITNGIRKKRPKDILIAVATFLIYGGLIFGLFKFREGISWAAHFSGVLAGIGFAFMQNKK